MGPFLIFHVFVFLIMQVTAQNCPAIYMRYSKEHTFCKPSNSQCKIVKTGVSPKDKQTILSIHNALRSKIATGNEKKLPKAGNMLQMVWDDELAAVAQKHASQCQFDHDCNECRQVLNFDVGQNLAEISTDSPVDPDWKVAIDGWYAEVQFFDRSVITPFVSDEEYGHFSQLAWADSWRIGCGWTSYNDGSDITQLYTCNYGPGGNVKRGAMYKQGAPCSACPINSCCDKTCGGKVDYPGLCKITNNKAPEYKSEGNYLYYCDFHGQPDCKFQSVGSGQWKVYETLSGSYLGVVVKGGQESTVVFEKSFKPSKPFCFEIYYRQGSNDARQPGAGKGVQTFNFGKDGDKMDLPVPKRKDVFQRFKMNLPWTEAIKTKVTFSVPAGKGDQFFEIQKLAVTDGKCPK